MKKSVELVERLIMVRRCAKVVKGGRRFKFVVMMVVGNRHGESWYGTGSAAEVSEARAKAVAQAKKHIVKISLRKDPETKALILHHDVYEKYGASNIIMKAVPSGNGIVAGGAARHVLDVIGISAAVVKLLGSRNPYNVVKAMYNGLLKSHSLTAIAAKRGKTVSEIVNMKESYGMRA